MKNPRERSQFYLLSHHDKELVVATITKTKANMFEFHGKIKKKEKNCANNKTYAEDLKDLNRFIINLAQNFCIETVLSLFFLFNFGIFKHSI